MNKIFAFLRRERDQFYQLSPAGRCLLISFFLVSVAQPVLNLFTNAFLWRTTSSITALIVYNLGFYLTLPLGFYLNGWLLRYYAATKLYWSACVLQGLVVFVLMMFSVSSLWWIGGLGVIFGAALGLFWANRHPLTLAQTQSNDRLYFGSLESVMGTATSLVMPFLIGWFLVVGERSGWYTTRQAYMTIGTLACVVLAYAGSYVRDLAHVTQAPKKLLLPNPSPRWRQARWLGVIHGIHSGVESVVPIVIMLFLLKTESSLGAIGSLTALVAMFATYVVGRIASTQQRPRLLAIWLIGEIAAGVCLGLSFSVLGIIVFTVLTSIVRNTRWITLVSLTYDVIEEEARYHGQQAYVYLADREAFLALGRAAGLLILLLATQWEVAITLRFTMLISALLQLTVYGVARNLNQSLAPVSIKL